MRTILHSDMNAFYASVELLYHPDLRGKAVAVGGDPELRHGIVLAKSEAAKKAGVKTGMALWQARQLCPEILFLPPHYDRYMRFSKLAREIYGEYTDRVEPFGLDECWLDITDSVAIKGDGAKVAQEIRARIKRELGVTVSIGVSWNKIFAKFGSDYKKPDAITVVSRDSYKDIVWPRPAGDLLYVGRATKRKLASLGIRTIGEIAQTDPTILKGLLGKMGLVLYAFANGEDQTPVEMENTCAPVKSIGNGMTAPRDLVQESDVALVVYLLSESVSARLREQGFCARVIEIGVRDNDLLCFTRQRKIDVPTDITGEIATEAMRLFREHYDWRRPIRSLVVRAASLVPSDAPWQIGLFRDPVRRDKERIMDSAVDTIRRRFGYYAIRRGRMLCDSELSMLDAKSDNTIHPRSYMDRGNKVGIEDILTV